MESVVLTGSSDRNEKNELAVREVVKRFVEALNGNDMGAFSALFDEDADFVAVTGKYLKGRSEIVAYNSDLVTGSFKGTHLTLTSLAVRFLSPDVAIARLATKRTDDAGGGVRTSFPMFVLTRRQNEWLIAAVQSSLTSGPPITPVSATVS